MHRNEDGGWSEEKKRFLLIQQSILQFLGIVLRSSKNPPPMIIRSIQAGTRVDKALLYRLNQARSCLLISGDDLLLLHHQVGTLFKMQSDNNNMKK